mgnify:CR=1 FL=1
MKLITVGGGILGTSHALAAVERGHDVLLIEREREARGATVRNFGLVWVSGRSSGELAAAQRSRDLWEKIGTDVTEIHCPDGKLFLSAAIDFYDGMPIAVTM